MYLFKHQVIYTLIGFITFLIFIEVKSSIWFNRVGALLFILSSVLLISMCFLPAYLVPIIDGKKLYILFGRIHIYPMLFFMLGSIWFMSYIYSTKTLKEFRLYTVGLILVSGLFTLLFHDYKMFLFLELVLIFLLFYTTGFNKYIIGSIAGISLLLGLFIVEAPHRILRLKNWLSSFGSYDVSKTLLEFNTLSLFIVLVFLFLIFSIIKKESKTKESQFFALSVVVVFTISLALNILTLFGFLPVAPPSLYFFDYGLSITLVSYMMIGMLVL
jgi:cell division protein FtsW (lipid II flippase)